MDGRKAILVLSTDICTAGTDLNSIGLPIEQALDKIQTVIDIIRSNSIIQKFTGLRPKYSRQTPHSKILIEKFHDRFPGIPFIESTALYANDYWGDAPKPFRNGIDHVFGNMDKSPTPKDSHLLIVTGRNLVSALLYEELIPLGKWKDKGGVIEVSIP